MDVSPVFIRVHGIRQLRRASRRVAGVSLAKEVRAANLEGARIVEAEARPNVTQVTGNLRRTLGSGATQRAGYVQMGNADIVYAGPYHFGWPARNIRPQPVLYEALDRRAEEIMSRYLAAVDRALDALDNPSARDT